MGLTLSNIKDTNKIETVLAENIREIIYSSEDENPRKYNKNFPNERFATNLELSECISSVISDAICGISIQMIKYVLV